MQCTPGDNLAVHVAVTRAPSGAALVVDVGDERELGYWGEVLTTAAEARGLAGLVIDGGVRDVTALDLHQAFERSVRLPVRGTSVKLVAPWLGFAWSNPNADAEWSTAIFDAIERPRNVIMHSGTLSPPDVARIGTNLRDWIGERAQAGRLPPAGFPRQKRF